MQQKLLTGLFSLMVLLISCKQKQQLPDITASLDTLYQSPFGFDGYIARVSFRNNSDTTIYLNADNQMSFTANDVVDSIRDLTFLLRDSKNKLVQLDWEVALFVCHMLYPPPLYPDSIIDLNRRFREDLVNANAQVKHLKNKSVYIIPKGSLVKLNFFLHNSDYSLDHLAGEKTKDYHLEAVLRVEYGSDTTHLKEHFVSFTSPLLDKVFLEE